MSENSDLPFILDMYILRISPKAFVKQGQDGDIAVISDYTKATTFDAIGDAMRAAARINENLEINKVHVLSI